MSQNKKTSPSHAKKSPQKKTGKTNGLAIFFTTFLAVMGVISLCVSGLLWYFRYNRNSELDALTDEQLNVNTELSDDVTNIALFGIDTRSMSNFRGNSDSIMILSIDNVHHSIKITSVMRDSLVPVQGHDVRKINAAYSYGGPELAIKTLNETFNLNIRDYATVNFLGMADIIDAMGGIEVEITEAERIHANGNMYALSLSSGTPCVMIEKAGKQTLNGMQAVSFARIRKVSTIDGVRDDYGRTDRQRYVMEQLFNKALSMGKSKYPAIIKSLLPYMETSLSYADIFNMAGVLTGDIKFEQARIPQGYSMIITERDVPTSLGSVLYYDLNYASDMLHAFVYDSIHPDEYVKVYPPRTTPWYTTWKQQQEQTQQ
jgi:LCP family protein required for cell wall assembly